MRKNAANSSHSSLSVSDRVLLALKFVVLLGILLTPAMDRVWTSVFIPFSWIPRLMMYTLLILALVWDTVLGFLIALWLMAIVLAVKRQEMRLEKSDR